MSVSEVSHYAYEILSIYISLCKIVECTNKDLSNLFTHKHTDLNGVCANMTDTNNSDRHPHVPNLTPFFLIFQTGLLTATIMKATNHLH